MTTHSSILAWEIPWTEDPGHGVPESDAKKHTHILIIQHHRGKNMVINVDFPSFGKAFRKKNEN